MSIDESLAWQYINNSKTIAINGEWLETNYSPKYSTELKMEMAMRIGQLEKEGWGIIKNLEGKYGAQAELFYAAGICHQPEAKDWLMQNIYINDTFNLEVLQALSIWGDLLSNKLLNKILNEPNLKIKLAGLDLLNFKAHNLSDKELIDLTAFLLDDIRDPIIIKTIQILQRRDSEQITNIIGKVALNGTNLTAKAALIALGSIGTKHSFDLLSNIKNNLPTPELRQFAEKQILHQYRYINNSKVF